MVIYDLRFAIVDCRFAICVLVGCDISRDCGVCEEREHFMASKKYKTYDDDLLVELIACGGFTAREIGKCVGLGRKMINHIVGGRRRKDLQERIFEAVMNNRRQAHRFGVRWLKPLLSKHIRNGIEGDDETARKCREFALNRFLGEQDEQDKPPDTDQPLPTVLTADDYKALAKLKGGPREDETSSQQG